MPRTKKTARKTVRKTTTRRKGPVRYAQTRAPMFRGGGLMSSGGYIRSGGMPEKAQTFKDAAQVAIAPGGVRKIYIFKPNTLQQPFDATDMTTQPAYLDQEAAIYRGGMVMSGRYRITWASTTANPTTICVYTSGDDTSKTTLVNFMAQPNAKYKTIQQAGSGEVATLIVPFRTAQLGIPLDRSSMGSENLSGIAVGDLPSKKLYMHVIVESSSANITGQLIVESLQNAILYDRKGVVDA